MCRVLLLMFCLFMPLFAGAIAWAGAQTGIEKIDSQSAVILVYHRVGEEGFPPSNISQEAFEQHLEAIKSGGYNVLPMRAVLQAWQDGAELPPRALVLSFDGGHRSILAHAVPKLLEAGLPFTLFVPPARMGWDSPRFMSWEDLRDLEGEGLVEFGLHPPNYQRLVGQSPAQIESRLERAQALFHEKMGFPARYFAYPFGVESLPYRGVLSKRGFSAGFGHHSGVAYPGADRMALPRFPMTEGYADLQRFHLAAAALVLPVHEVRPRNTYFDVPERFQDTRLSFSLSPFIESPRKLACFATGQGRVPLTWTGTHSVRLEGLSLIRQDRTRINCTLPGPGDGRDAESLQRWRWKGFLFHSNEKGRE